MRSRHRFLLSLPLLPLLYVGCATTETAAVQERATPTATRSIRPDGFPANRPYSFGVLAGDTLYLSGQLGQHPATGARPEGAGAQTRQAMENIGEVLKAAGMDHRHLVKCHVYLDSMDDYAAMNQAYGSFFIERVPARTTVEAVRLPADALVEIACVAYRDLSRISVVRPAQGTLPAPLGPYSAGVWAGDTLFLSGMGGQFPDGRPLAEPLAGQVTQTLRNIGTTLTAAGLAFPDVVASNAYVTKPEEAVDLPAAFDREFPTSGPPRGLIFLPRLPGPIKAEITFVAVRPSADRRIIASAGESGNAPRGVLVGDVLYTRTESAAAAGAAFDEQFSAVLNQLKATVREAGLQWTDVVHMPVYLTDLQSMQAMDRIFREAFPVDPPARTTIQVQPRGGELVQASLVARGR